MWVPCRRTCVRRCSIASSTSWPAVPSSSDRAASAIIEEGRLLAKVRHPNVVTIYGAEQISDQIGLWMEFVRGHTLEQILDQQRWSAPPKLWA